MESGGSVGCKDLYVLGVGTGWVHRPVLWDSSVTSTEHYVRSSLSLNLGGTSFETSYPFPILP